MAAPWDQESLLQAIKQDPEFCVKCPTLAADIHARRLSLVTLVEYLKDLLTDPEPSQRAVGILVLSSVLRELPSDFLREDELRFIAVFFCDRLKDHHDVIPAALKGILSILRMKNLDGESPAQILTTLMLNINCQSQRQEDRLTIYRILDSLVIPHLDSLKNLGPDLTYHIISAVDGERDPRNLKFLFSMLPAIFKGISLGHLTEDCFEVMACYFPVDFQPAAADRNQITREVLATSLAECLTAVPEFSEFCFPLLLEKLNSSLRQAKVDSLHLLKKGCQVFPAKEVAVHISPLWMSLSREALSGPDYEIREAARECVTYLLRCLSDMPLVNGQQSDPMKQLLGDVVSASLSSLGEVHTTLFTPASDLLLSAAKSCTVACEHILVKVTPLLVDYFNGTQEAADRSIYLRIISRFIAVCKLQRVTPQNIPDICMQWNLMVQMYFSSAEHVSALVRKEALFGLTSLAPTLNSSERIRLFDLLCHVVDQENSPDVRDQCKCCLCEIGHHHPSEVSSYILSERLKFDEMPTNDSRFERRLEAQCCLAGVKPFAEEILPIVINLVLLSNDPCKIHASISSLRKLLENTEDNKQYLYACMHKQCNVVPRLLNWWISSVQNVQECEWVNNDATLQETCHVISVVTRNLPIEDQAPLVHLAVSQFYPGSDSFRPCEASSPKCHILTVAMFEAVLGSAHNSVPVSEVHHICSALTKLAIGCRYSSTVISASRLCASLLNKLPDVNLLGNILADISSMLSCAHAQNEEQDAMQAASMYGWVIKGLAMRGYSGVELWVEKLVDLLGDNRKAIALSAAKAFQILMEDSPTFLNSESHCINRLLYKQRIFVAALKLVEKSREVPVGGRIAYLLALTHLLSGVSQTVLASHLGQVLPLLLESLALDSTALLEAALETLYGLLVQTAFSDSFKDNIQTMVPRLLPLTSYEHSIKVRSRSLLCLCEICNLPTELLLPFKDEVTSKLQVCLDDSKRMVRKDAVKARNCWILLAAPGGKR